MKPSLSVVVPLYNVQGALTDTVEQLLEIVPELTSLFEIVLVDDGSTDATRDVAQELSLAYPQVQVVVQSTRLGPQASFRGALRFAQGEILLLCTDQPAFDLHDIRKLWDERNGGGAVWGQCSGRMPMTGATSGQARGESRLPDLLLVPRRLLSAWPQRGPASDLLVYLRERGFGLRNVELRPRRSFGGWQPAGPAFTTRSAARMHVRGAARAKTVHDPVAPPLGWSSVPSARLRSLMRGE